MEGKLWVLCTNRGESMNFLAFNFLLYKYKLKTFLKTLQESIVVYPTFRDCGIYYTSYYLPTFMLFKTQFKNFKNLHDYYCRNFLNPFKNLLIRDSIIRFYKVYKVLCFSRYGNHLTPFYKVYKVWVI